MFKPLSSVSLSTLIATLSLTTLAGCASTPRPIGAVVPLEGGRYQSSAKASDTTQAMQFFTHDAEITCAKGDGGSAMPWSKPAPGKYVVVSQTAKTKDGKDIKSDNKTLDAGIAVGLRYIGLEAKDAVEVTTVFRCQ